jgi:hypothetical protein
LGSPSRDVTRMPMEKRPESSGAARYGKLGLLVL